MRRLDHGLPRAVLAAGLVLSALAAWEVQRRNEHTLETQSQLIATRAVERAVYQLDRAALGLRGARGYFLGAGVDQATRAGFRGYYESRDLAREFPGVMGIGLIRQVSPAAEAEFVAHARRQGTPDFSIRTLTPHEGDRLIIQYVEPVETNRAAIGLDTASEANRRRTGSLALQTDAPFVTGPIRLVQSAPGSSMGVLLMLRMPPGSVPPAFGVTAGAIVYSPIQLDQLLDAVDVGEGLVQVQIEDRTDPAQSQSFELPVRGPAPVAGTALQVMDREVMGRLWRFTVTPLPALAASLKPTPPWAVGAVLALISVLLAQLAATTLRLRRQTVERLAERTRLATLLDHAGDAIVGLDPEGRVTLWNRAAASLFGFRAEDALGRPLRDLSVDPDHADEDARLLAEALAGRSVPPIETERRHCDGRMVAVELSAGPVYDDAGHVVGVAKVLRPIGERLAMSRELQAHASQLEAQVAERTRQYQQAEQDLRNVLDAMPLMVGSWDKRLRNRFANKEYARFFGRDPASLRDVPAHELLGPELWGRNQPYIDAVLAGQEQRFERDLPLADGSGLRHTWAHYIPQRQGDEVVGFYVLVHDVTELKNAQTRLQNIIDGTQAGTWEWNVATGQTVFNERWAEIVGHTLDELAPVSIDTWMALAHPDDLTRSGELLQAHFRGELPAYEFEARMRHKDGHWVWVLDRGRLVSRTAEGQPLWMAGTHQDITERKQAEQALRHSQAMLARTGAMARVGGWEVDLVENRIWWSDETCRIHGRPPGYQCEMEEAISYYAPEARPVIQRLVEQGMSEGRSWDVELPFLPAGGDRIWVRAVGEVEFSDGRPVRLVGAFQDVTAQHEATTALKAQQELLEAAMRVTRTGLAIYDREDRLSFCNDRYRELYGSSAQALQIGAPYSGIARAYCAAELRQLAAPEAEAWLQDRLLHRRGGGDFLRAVGGRHVRVVERELPSGQLVSLRQDVTELVEARASAEAASKAKSAFLASTSHEIRTPLNAILGLTYLLERSPLSETDRQQVRQIGQAGRALLTLINDVLDISKIEAGQLELETLDFNVAQLVRDEAALIGVGLQGGPVALRVQVDRDVPALVRGDPTRLRQVLANLLSNAAKFTSKGSIDVRLGRGSGPPWLELEVADTGIGIDAAVQHRLFQPFEQADVSTTRRFGGTGLGLAITAQLVELMGGSITLDSALGTGSTFIVRLPLPEVEPDGRQPALGDVAPLRVLLADDDDTQREWLLELGRALGWRCTAVNGGQALMTEALAAARGGSPYDALVVDWQMPDLDGLGALQRLRQQLPETAWPAAVVISQHEFAELKAAPHAALASAMLIKPIDGSKLFNAVNQSVASIPERAGRLLEVSEVGQADTLWLAGIRVLVVDDSSINLDVARRVLELEGAEVTTCQSGAEALAMAREGVAEIDVALLDIQMPDMDGIELLRRLRDVPGWADRPAIALTAGVQNFEREAAVAAGMNDFLPKPLEPRRLIRCLRRHVEISRGQVVPVRARHTPAGTAQVSAPLGVAGIDESQIAPSVRQDRALLLSMIRRVLDEHGALATVPPERLPAVLHKLRGSAGVIGATDLAAAALRAEQALKAGDAPSAQAEVVEQLAQLAASASALLREEDARLSSQPVGADPAGAGSLTAAELAELMHLLDEQNVRAMEWIISHATPLTATIGHAAVKRLQDALDQFDFASARNELPSPVEGR